MTYEFFSASAFLTAARTVLKAVTKLSAWAAVVGPFNTSDLLARAAQTSCAAISRLFMGWLRREVEVLAAPLPTVAPRLFPGGPRLWGAA